MSVLKFLLEKEFKQILRNKFLLRIILMLPILQLLILPFAANFEMKNINVSLVDHDRSSYSQRLMDQIVSSGYFRITDVSSGYSEALRSIESNRADLILEIPFRFEQQFTTEGIAKVLVACNAVNGTKGGMGSSYLSSILGDFNRELLAEQGVELSEVSGIEYTTVHLFNPHLDYKTYMVPGIIVFLITIIGGFLPALNIVSEKEKGTIEQMNVTPVLKVTFILSKLIPFWLIGFVLLTLGMSIAYLVYGLFPAGNIGLIYLFAAVYLVAFTGLGLFISTISSSQQQAMFTAFFFIIIFVLMSGLFTPISSMPEWAKTITLFNPLRYFIEVMRMVYLKGSSFADLSFPFLALCGFAVVFNTLAVLTYRKGS